MDFQVRATRKAVRILCTITAFFALALLQTDSFSQPYPSKPVRIVVSFAPGGGTDVIARLVAQKLSEKMGQTFVVDNKPGGNGVIGSQTVATAQPDGYTLYFASSDHVILGPNLFTNLPYDTVKDFSPITSVARQNLVLVVHPSVPAQSVKEFISMSKSKPGELNYSSAGTGSATHLTGELFQSRTEVKLTHVPYKGSAPAITDLLAGRDVKVSFAAVAPIVPHIKTGKVRALGVTSAARLNALPEVPTMAEAGIADFDIFFWFGLFAPAGTPKEVISELNKHLTAVLQSLDVVERITALGAEPMGGTPEELGALVRTELPRWGKIIRDAGIPRTPL